MWGDDKGDIFEVNMISGYPMRNVELQGFGDFGVVKPDIDYWT